MIKISVIIPIYNVEKYVGRCIESILSQTFQDFEIVVVNDCTSDCSMDVVLKYANNDKRIKLFDHDQNQGLMWARKTGYSNALGEYFVFCDSDDYMPSNALEVLYNAIIETKADIVVGNLTYIAVNGKTTIKKNQLNYGTDKVSIFKALLKRELSHSLCGKIFSRNLFDNHNYDTFRDHINAEDAILFYQLISNTSIVQKVDDSVYNYMQNMESSTNKLFNDNQIICIERFWNICYDIVSHYDELLNLFYEYKYHSIINLLKRGEYLEIITRNSTVANFDHFFKLGSSIKYNKSFIDIVLNYLVINSVCFRCIYHKMR